MNYYLLAVEYWYCPHPDRSEIMYSVVTGVGDCVSIHDRTLTTEIHSVDVYSLLQVLVTK